MAAFCSILAVILFGSCTLPKQAPAKLSFLHAKDRSIVDEAGRVVALRGCNSGSWLAVEPWILGWDLPRELHYEKSLWDVLGRRFGEEEKRALIREFRTTFFTENDVRLIAENGMNCLRIPVWWRAVSDPAYAGNIEYLDAAIRWCAENGIYAIIGLHGAPGGQHNWPCGGEPDDLEPWKTEEEKALTEKWWRDIATRYRDEPAVAGYDILNEPVDAPPDELPGFFDRLYQAIRAVDAKHMIFVQNGVRGFHSLPHPRRMGWSNVVYSFHYYPQSPLEGVEADAYIYPRFNRASVYYGVPVLVGEFNTMNLRHGGTDSFRRHMDVFDYFGWSWTFWTYKKMEIKSDELWGLYGRRDSLIEVNVQTDPPEKIQSAFEQMKTGATQVNPGLQAVLRQAPAQFVHPDNPAGVQLLPLKDAYILRARTDEGIRLEWGFGLPDAHYWGVEDRMVWPLTIERSGSYALSLSLAGVKPDNDIEVWVDGIHVMNGRGMNSSGSWSRFVDRDLGVLHLEAGPHLIELAHGKSGEPFINLRYAMLKPAKEKAVEPDEIGVRLDGVNMEFPAAGSSMCVQWLYDPSAIGYWRSGEKATWKINLLKGGTYSSRITFASPNSNTVLKVLVDGQMAASAVLPSTGDWGAYTTLPMEAVSLPPGRHEVTLEWESQNPDGCGNLKDVEFRRE